MVNESHQLKVRRDFACRVFGKLLSDWRWDYLLEAFTPYFLIKSRRFAWSFQLSQYQLSKRPEGEVKS